MGHVLISFVDHGGTPRLAKVTNAIYHDLITRASIYEEMGRATRSGRKPEEVLNRWIDDDGNIITRGRERVRFYWDPWVGPKNPHFNGPSPRSIKIKQLLDLAGVEDTQITADNVNAIIRRAKRRCHPDLGNDDSSWLRLEKLVKELGYKW